MLREHLDAYLSYFRYKTLEITQSQQPFQVIFNPIPGINNGTFYRTIHPRNLTLPIQNIFTSYINQLIEHNENLDTPIYRPSLLEELKEKVDLFEVPDLDTKIIRHNNPHYWLQQDILQATTFQYKFFKNISLDDDTIPQIKVFSHFLLKFFRFNYQLIWEPKDQNAYIHFPQILNKTELLPFIIQNDSKHPYYKNFPTLHTSHIEAIELNSDFLIEQSETSDSRPYTNLFQNNTTEEENQSSEISDNRQYMHLTQDHNTADENVIQHQPTTPRHTSQITHDSTESVQDTITNPPNTSSTTTDSNALQVPTRNITENNTYPFNQENPSTISMTNDTETLSSSIHQTIPRNYDPPPPPSIHSTHSTPHNSPQQGSSNTFSTQQPPLNETQFQTTTPPIQLPQTIPYIPAQIPVQYNNPPILTINTLHTNPISNATTSSTLSRPPLPLIQNNPLMYNLTSTNIQSQLNTNNTQTNLNVSHSNTHHQTHLPSAITHPPPHIQSVPIQPQVNVLNIPPTSSNPSTLHTIPPNTTPPSTINTPTYINSATSISEPIKPFDGLDHNSTPEEYLQHIEARVTFSLGLQPHTTHEYKFWHARRMAFIQCSLTGTALSWYIRLTDTYKQDWHAFVQAFKKQFSSQKNAYYAQVEALSLTKKDNETVRHFPLRIQQLVEKGWCNENASTINLKCNEIFTKGLPKNPKDFANKRQVKHTSTVLEPSIPFHTLVKLVDAEDIANDKIRTHDLTLEVNNLTKQLQSQSLNQQQTDQIMFTQPRDPNNKTKPAYKKYCSYCHRTNHSISACFKKQRDDEDKRDRYARSKSTQKSFVQYFRSSSNDRTQRSDTRPNEYPTRYRSRSTSRHDYQKHNRQRSISRTRYNYDRTTTPPHYTRSRYDNYHRDSRSYRSPCRSSYRSPHKRDSRSRYRSRSYSRDNNFPRYTSSYRPPSRPRDSRYSRSRSHSQTRNKNIKYNILGTPFFEENIQNINIQDFTLHFKTHSRVYPNYAKFTSLLSKDYPYFSYIYRINSKTQIRLKPNTSKIAHFPNNNYYNLHFSTTPQKQFFPTIPHTYFSSKFRTTFNFIEVFTDDKPDTCATIIQNSTNHIATLPTGHIGYIEVPITNEKPKYYQVNDINTLIHNVTHTYHPEITELIPTTNYSTTTEQQPISPTQFSLNQVYMTDTDSLPHSPSLYNVQPTSHSSKQRVFPSLPYSPENLKFINKFNFQFSDLTDTEYITLCNLLLKYKTCYATHKNDVGKIATPFRIRLKPNAQLLTQRPSKVPFHYRDKLNTLLKDLEKHNIIKQIGSSPQDKPVYGTTYLNPLIIIPKGDSIKCVLDARHLNSNTEQSDESWPIEPLAPQLARANKKYKSAIDLMYAYAHTPLDEETIKLTSFSSGDKLFAFIRGFYGLKGLPIFFTEQMSSFFKTLIEQGFALVYIDDILLLSNSEEHMFQLIEQLHTISAKNNLKLAPEKSFFMLLKSSF